MGIISQNPEKSKHLETATMRVGAFWIDFVNLRTEAYTDGSRIPAMMDIGGPEVCVHVAMSTVLCNNSTRRAQPIHTQHPTHPSRPSSPFTHTHTHTLHDPPSQNHPRTNHAPNSSTYTQHSNIPPPNEQQEDALRRDLTINSLFYNVNTGEVEDFSGRGLADMRDGKKRVSHGCACALALPFDGGMRNGRRVPPVFVVCLMYEDVYT